MATETQTQTTDYTDYLVHNEAPWMKALDVQRVYCNRPRSLKLQYSTLFPHALSGLFKYNEFLAIARKTA